MTDFLPANDPRAEARIIKLERALAACEQRHREQVEANKKLRARAHEVEQEAQALHLKRQALDAEEQRRRAEYDKWKQEQEARLKQAQQYVLKEQTELETVRAAHIVPPLGILVVTILDEPTGKEHVLLEPVRTSEDGLGFMRRVIEKPAEVAARLAQADLTQHFQQTLGGTVRYFFVGWGVFQRPIPELKYFIPYQKDK